MEKIIEMSQVSWKRQGKQVLSEIDWTVKKGEHWAILGLNGSGKTTLLNMVNGYIWPTTGRVTVLDCPFGRTNIHELRKRIGWVSSSLGQRINERSLVEDLVVSGKFASTGLYDDPSVQDRKDALELLDKLQIAYLKGRLYATCSQGERQRILIARGLMAKPELLILDEPTNGLDFIAREQLLETITTLAKEVDGPTLVFVTHHIEEITNDFTHTLFMQDGRATHQGLTTDLLTEDTLSELFQTDIAVQWRKERAWIQLKES